MLIVFALFVISVAISFAMGLWVSYGIDKAMMQSSCDSTEKIVELQSRTMDVLKEHLKILGAEGY